MTTHTYVEVDRIGAMGGRAILVLGDVNVDVMARLPAALAPGGDNLPQRIEFQLGGVGANVAVALAKWGVEARLAGRRFPPELLHSTDNIVSLPIEVHRRVSARMSSKDDYTEGKR